jgi:hypothetical protein
MKGLLDRETILRYSNPCWFRGGAFMSLASVLDLNFAIFTRAMYFLYTLRSDWMAAKLVCLQRAGC